MKITLDREEGGKDNVRGESHHSFAIRLLIFKAQGHDSRFASTVC